MSEILSPMEVLILRATNDTPRHLKTIIADAGIAYPTATFSAVMGSLARRGYVTARYDKARDWGVKCYAITTVGQRALEKYEPEPTLTDTIYNGREQVYAPTIEEQLRARIAELEAENEALSRIVDHAMITFTTGEPGKERLVMVNHLIALLEARKGASDETTD